MIDRRTLTVAIGTLAVWSHRTHAADIPRPVVGFLGGRSAKTDAHLLAALLEGLGAEGFVDGRDVHIEFRWADGRYERLPALAAELVRLKPAVIVAVGGSAVGVAVRAATSSIPVVFAVGGDPIALGLVSDLARPEGNFTGVTTYSAPLDAKRLELLRDVAPAAKVVAVILNPRNPNAADEARQARSAAAALGQTVHLFEAGSDQQLDAAFGAVARLRPDGLAVASDSFLIGRRTTIVARVAELRLPAVYAVREFAEAGGLMSYGANFAAMYRVVGGYAGRVLRGAAPSQLPVQQPTRYEFVVNLRTARALGLAFPQSLLLRADEVIE